jgi:hypothetical protein
MIGGGWLPMNSAPRDGRPITVAALGRCKLGTGNLHELPYPVRFLNGRWVYASNDAPVFPWQQPLRWRQ